MKLLKGVNQDEMLMCNRIWNDLLLSNFGDEEIIKQFDSLTIKSNDNEKNFRIFIYLAQEHTSSNEKALNFIRQKIENRKRLISVELQKVKKDNEEANKVIDDINDSNEIFYKKGEALEQKFDELPAKFVLVFRNFNRTINEESAKKFIKNLEENSLENFVAPFLSLNISLFDLISEQNFAINELQKFYIELEGILVARLEYRKEKTKRANDYREALNNCDNYEKQEDKLVAENEAINELLKFLNEKTNNNSSQSNVEIIIENVKAWFNNPNVDSSIKNQIKFFANFQVDFAINDKGEIVIKELLFDNTIKISIISFENLEDYLLCKSLVEKIKGNIIKKDDLDSYVEYLDVEHTYDYVKETLICLILYGFFVEEQININFVDDSLPEFIDAKLREKLSRMSYSTPSYVRSLQLLKTKTD